MAPDGGSQESHPEKLVLEIGMNGEESRCEIAFYSRIHHDIHDLEEAGKRASHWEEMLKKMAGV